MIIQIVHTMLNIFLMILKMFGSIIHQLFPFSIIRLIPAEIHGFIILLIFLSFI